jgi:hypothetical protein
MDGIKFAAALACAALPGFAGAQSVEIRTGANGQLSGTATAGSASTSVSTGTSDEPRNSDGVRDYSRPRCEPGGAGRSLRVVGPGGSSTSSVSVSGGGTAAVAGAGSPGSQIYEDDRAGCPHPQAVAAPRGTTAVTSQNRPHRAVPRRRRLARR